MSGLYMTGMVDALRRAGCKVAENATTNGWQERARSSGGFPVMPLGVQWHHTASSTSPQNDLAYMIDGSDDAPIGNVLLDRTGTFWPIAAGASNTAGKGGPLVMSRGTIPLDQGNTHSFAIECANNGVGEPWPQVQIDAFFDGSNALNAMLGNAPTDVFTHALGAGDGYTSRKIDPATAAAVQGPWRPRSVTSSGTWSLADIRAECARRAAPVPPTPTPEPEVLDMFAIDWHHNAAKPDEYTGFVCSGTTLSWIATGTANGVYRSMGLEFGSDRRRDVSAAELLDLIRSTSQTTAPPPSLTPDMLREWHTV